MRPGSIAGLIGGLVVCGIITVVVMVVSKKDGAKVEDILATTPPEAVNALKNQPITQAEGKNMYIKSALVASAEDMGDKLKLTLLMHDPERDQLYTKGTKIDKADAANRGIGPGVLVPCLMKYDTEMHYYDFKKLA